MALVSAGNAQLKAKLQQKGRWRPYAAMRKKLPDGSALLSDLPKRADAPEGDEKAEAEYCEAVQKLSRVFGKQRRSNSTADEHKMYMRIKPSSSRRMAGHVLVRPKASELSQ